MGLRLGMAASSYGVQLACTENRENRGGRVTVAVAVEESNVPASGVESTHDRPGLRDQGEMHHRTDGYSAPVELDGDRSSVSTVTSGVRKLAVGFAGTATPPMAAMRTVGACRGEDWTGSREHGAGSILPETVLVGLQSDAAVRGSAAAHGLCALNSRECLG